MRRTVLIGAILAMLAAGGEHDRLVRGESPAPAAADATPIGDLVSRLGSESFADREAAAAALVERGGAAHEELAAAARNHRDFEVRLRCRELLGRLSRADLEAKLSAFISGEPLGEPLPGWEEFQKFSAGESGPPSGDAAKGDREFFAQMTRLETPLIESLAAGPRSAGDALDERVEAFDTQVVEERLVAKVDPPSAAALLLAAAAAGDAVDEETELALVSYFSMPGVERSVLRSRQVDVLRRLMRGWIGRRALADSASDFLHLASQYDLAGTGLDIARRLLKSEDAATHDLPEAILAIGRFGDESDSAAIEPLLANDQLCHTLHRNNEVIRIEVRDVALAVLWHLQGADPKDHGFELLQSSDRTLFAIYSLGFVADEKRQAALQLWREKGMPAKDADDAAN